MSNADRHLDPTFHTSITSLEQPPGPPVYAAVIEGHADAEQRGHERGRADATKRGPVDALSTALSTLGRLAPLGSPENTGLRYSLDLVRDAASRSSILVVSSRFDHNGARPEVYAKEEVPDIISEDGDERDTMLLAAAMRLLVAVAGTTALVKAGVIKWAGAPIDASKGFEGALLQQVITDAPRIMAAALQQDREAYALEAMQHVNRYVPNTRRVLVHADGGICHGIPLVDGRCPSCLITPDSQSVELWTEDAIKAERDKRWDLMSPTVDLTPGMRHTVTMGSNGSFTVTVDAGGPRDAFDVTRDSNGLTVTTNQPASMTSEQWSASLRAKLAASEVLHGPFIACQGDYDDE